MIITCPSCATQFRVPDGALGSDGRKLRCSACRHVWFQAPLVEAPAEPPAEPEETPVAPSDTAPPEAGESAPEPREAIAPPEATEDETAAETLAPVQETLPEPEAEAPVITAAPAGEENPEISQESEAPDAVDSQAEGESVAADGSLDADESVTAGPTDEIGAAPREPGPAASSGWEPGAVMPRNPRRETAAEPGRPGLRLVPHDKPADGAEEKPAQAQARSEPAAPAYDVTRVVTPDSAPEDKADKPRRKRGNGKILVLLLLIAVLAVAYFERTQVMRFLPQTADFYGMLGLVGAPGSQGLQLHDVSFRVEEVGGTPSLIVSGSVINVGRDYRRLPALHVMLLDGKLEASEVWSLRAMADGLAPGATTLFEGVYPDPPRTGSNENLFVTFADLM